MLRLAVVNAWMEYCRANIFLKMKIKDIHIQNGSE